MVRLLVRCPGCSTHVRVEEVACPFCATARPDAGDRSGIKRGLSAVTIASVLAISCGAYGGGPYYPPPIDAPADAHHGDAASDGNHGDATPLDAAKDAPGSGSALAQGSGDSGVVEHR